MGLMTTRLSAVVLVSAAAALLTSAGCAMQSPRVVSIPPVTQPVGVAGASGPALPTSTVGEIADYRPGTYAVLNGQAVAIPQVPMGNPETIRRIVAAGTRENRVMDHLEHLTKVIGPRLTSSARCEEANIWTRDLMAGWGLTASLHKWGEAATRFDRGPSTGTVFARDQRRRRGSEQAEESPWKATRQLEFTTLSWTRGTDGPKRGPVVRLPENEDEYNKVRSQLNGAWVLLKPTALGGRAGVRAGTQQAGDRFTSRKEARAKVAAGTDPQTLAMDDRVVFDGVLGFIVAPQDERDRVWTSAAPKWRDRVIDEIPTDVEVTVRLSDYDYINSRITDGDEFQVQFDLQHTLTSGPVPLYNTIGEITGTTYPDEVVYVMGHLDSWDGPGSHGAIDNGTGVATTLEAARLLAVAKARPKRTIRFALWTGEEQGLLGAKQYVKDQEANWSKISAALNDDGGTNYQGGLKATSDMADTLLAATAPVNGWFIDNATGKPMVVNVQVQESFPRFASSDHFAFVDVGIPGFFWDEVGRQDYGWAWHTQHDKFNMAIPEYLMQSATCAAVTAYNLANAPSVLPRVPKPPAQQPN